MPFLLVVVLATHVAVVPGQGLGDYVNVDVGVVDHGGHFVTLETVVIVPFVVAAWQFLFDYLLQAAVVLVAEEVIEQVVLDFFVLNRDPLDHLSLERGVVARLVAGVVIEVEYLPAVEGGLLIGVVAGGVLDHGRLLVGEE